MGQPIALGCIARAAGNNQISGIVRTTAGERNYMIDLVILSGGSFAVIALALLCFVLPLNVSAGMIAFCVALVGAATSEFSASLFGVGGAPFTLAHTGFLWIAFASPLRQKYLFAIGNVPFSTSGFRLFRVCLTVFSRALCVFSPVGLVSLMVFDRQLLSINLPVLSIVLRELFPIFLPILLMVSGQFLSVGISVPAKALPSPCLVGHVVGFSASLARRIESVFACLARKEVFSCCGLPLHALGTLFQGYRFWGIICHRVGSMLSVFVEFHSFILAYFPFENRVSLLTVEVAV